MENDNKLLDRHAKVFLLNILKKGYFNEKDIEFLSKWLVFSIPIEAWIDIDFKKYKKH